MARLSWRERALHDDEFGRRFDRWFGLGCGSGLLICGAAVAIRDGSAATPAGVLLLIGAALVLLASWRFPQALTPFSLLFLSLFGILGFGPGGRRGNGEL